MKLESSWMLGVYNGVLRNNDCSALTHIVGLESFPVFKNNKVNWWQFNKRTEPLDPITMKLFHFCCDKKMMTETVIRMELGANLWTIQKSQSQKDASREEARKENPRNKKWDLYSENKTIFFMHICSSCNEWLYQWLWVKSHLKCRFKWDIKFIIEVSVNI